MKTEKIALVTGANRGIGFEVARQLAREGFRVFLGARKTEAGRAAAAGISEGKATFLELDVADPESIQRAVEEFAREADHLDALVNNAGVLLEGDEGALTITPQIFEQTLRTNTLGPWLVTQAFLPFLEKSGAPRIVNVSSGSGQLEGGADGWARLQRLENRAQWRHRATCGGPAELCRQLRLSWLGADRDGRHRRHSFHRGRRVRHRLAGSRRSAEPHRPIPPRPQSDSLVTPLNTD